MSPDSVMLEKVDSPRSPSRELPTDDNDHLTTTPQSAPPPNQSNDNNDQSFLLNERLTATELVKWAHIEGLNSFSRLPLVSTLVFTAAPTLPPNCHPFGLRVGNILRDGTDQHAWACVENPSRVRYFLLNARGRYIWISRNLRSSISSLPPFSTLMNDWDMLASLVAYYFVAGGTLAAFERVRRVKGTVDLDKLKMACESHAVALDEGAVSYPRVQEDDGVDRAEEGEQEEEQGKTGRKRGLEQNDSGASGSPEGRSKRSRRHVESTVSFLGLVRCWT